MGLLRWLGKGGMGVTTLIVAVLSAEARPQPKPPAREPAGSLDVEGAEK